MRFHVGGVLLSWLGAVAASSNQGFAQDVLRPSVEQAHKQQLKQQMQSEILSRAIPVAEYEKMLKDHGVTPPERDLEGENQDFYMDDDAMYSFSGFAIKYASCQPVQYFSEDVAAEGEQLSPMMTQDVVILRLCPTNVCSSSTQYGCHYNYVEYALSLADYVQIMLQFRAIQRDNVCEWCLQCSQQGGYQLYGNNGDDAVNDDYYGGRVLEEAQAQDDNVANEYQANDYQANDYQANEYQNNEYQNNEYQNNEYQNNEYQDNEEQGDGNGVSGCGSYFSTYCSNYYSECQEGENDDSQYEDYDKYLEYLDCSEAGGNGYYIRPRCDGYSNSIEMAVYFDAYCTQYTDSVNIRSLNLGFRQSIYEDFYSGECVDCSNSNYPPYFGTGSALCNNMHYAGARCTADLSYDLFDGEDDESSECNFIETLRFGTYDEKGELSSSLGGSMGESEVSTGQAVMVTLSVLAVVSLTIYACYLHHSMTNLLIKSLSHRELLPPSRHNRRRGDNRSVGGVSRRAPEPDWQPTDAKVV